MSCVLVHVYAWVLPPPPLFSLPLVILCIQFFLFCFILIHAVIHQNLLKGSTLLPLSPFIHNPFSPLFSFPPIMQSIFSHFLKFFRDVLSWGDFTWNCFSILNFCLSFINHHQPPQLYQSSFIQSSIFILDIYALSLYRFRTKDLL